jgi:hypothetical protein
MNQLLELLLLALGVGDRLLLGVRHTQCLQRRKGAAEPWLPRHMGLIHRGGEARRLGEAGKRLAPGTLMRGCEQDAVHVEDGCRQGPGIVGPGFL